MQFLSIMTANDLLNMCFLSWFIAQVLKTAIDWLTTKSFSVERMVGAGGMPSSHTSLVVALCVGTARIEGFRSTMFTISIVLAGIVMYDAMGVRRAAGEQAKVLNKIIFDFNNFFNNFKPHPFKLDFGEDNDENEESNEEGTKTLKEFLGHTPLEVLAGCLLGILVAVIYPL